MLSAFFGIGKNVQAFLEAIEPCCRKKKQKIFKIDRIQSNSPLEGFDPFDYESGYENFLRYTNEGLHIDFYEKPLSVRMHIKGF